MDASNDKLFEVVLGRFGGTRTGQRITMKLGDIQVPLTNLIMTITIIMAIMTTKNYDEAWRHSGEASHDHDQYS